MIRVINDGSKVFKLYDYHHYIFMLTSYKVK